MKRLLYVIFVVSLVMGLIGCTKRTAVGGEISGSGSPTIDRILEQGYINIGIGTGGPPTGFNDDQGNPIGYDVDWGRKLAETLGVEPRFVVVNGETRIPALTSGRIDVILNNITGTLERAKTIDFSIPYVIVGVKMLTRAESPYKVVEDLNKPECKVTLNRGTTSEAIVTQFAPNAEIVYVTTFSEQVLLVSQGKADAAFEDSSGIDYVAKNSNGELVAQEKLYSTDPLCLGVRKGDLEFLRFIDMFVSWQITQGWQQETYYKWWGNESPALKTLW
ncbi:MAG: transporter substrate-binding domain-containing protein [Spirochaetaceae bacterium]|nr:transporter substrate-binding domain-containing protein [Spirochaetaceae bacterium]